MPTVDYDYNSAVGNIQVKADGIFGVGLGLAQMDFSDPKSIFGGLSSIGAMIPIPGLGPALGAVLGVFGSLFPDGPTATEIALDNLAIGQTRILGAIGQLSSQISAGFQSLIDAQDANLLNMKNFTLQLRGDKQIAYSFLVSVMEEKNRLYLTDLQAIFQGTQTAINDIYIEAITEADTLLYLELNLLEANYQLFKSANLGLLAPFVENASNKLFSMANELNDKLKILAAIKAETAQITMFEERPFAESMVKKFFINFDNK